MAPGDWVLVHSGFALARLTADEAREAEQIRKTTTRGGAAMTRHDDAPASCWRWPPRAISGFSVFLNSYGVKAFGNPTAYTTAKNIVAALVLLAVVGVGLRAAPAPRLTRPQWAAASGGRWRRSA